MVLRIKKIARRRRIRRLQLRIALAVLVLVGFSGLFWLSVTAGKGAAASTSGSAVEQPAATPAPTPTPAPVMHEVENVDKSGWNTSTPVEQTLDTTLYAPDWRMNALPAGPAVAVNYFNTATFVGDSLTQGLELYSTGLPNAHFCAYKSIGPNAIVNKMTLTRANGTQEVAIDALVASQPDYVYMLLGTNSLVTQGNDDSFLAYYGAMIDMFQEALPEGVIYYVQAIPAVAADVVQSKPGLDNTRIRAINSRLAQLAQEKGCYFIDLQEALTGNDGNQIAEYAARDGIHYNAVGYQAWVDYLCTHVVYHKRNPYVGGNPYFIDMGDGSAPVVVEEPPVEEPAEEPPAEEIPAEGTPAEETSTEEAPAEQPAPGDIPA